MRHLIKKVKRVIEEMDALPGKLTFYEMCPVAVASGETQYQFNLAVKVPFPIKIGCNVKPCPKCGGPMSYGNNHYFCRKCIYVEY